MRRLAILRPDPARVRRSSGQARWAWIRSQFRCSRLSLWRGGARPDAVRCTSADQRQCFEFGGAGWPSFAHCRSTLLSERRPAAAAHLAGFQGARWGDGGLERLLGAIPDDLRLLHLCGRQPDGARCRQTITEVPVYRSVALPPPDGLARSRDRRWRCIRRAQVSAWQSLLGSCGSIAPPSASPRSARPPRTLRRRLGADRGGRRADDAALLALAARLCDKPVTR